MDRNGSLSDDVERIVNGGWGLVRHRDGAVFLRGVLPGERVRYHIRERSRGVLWGEVDELLVPSADRVSAPCDYYGDCGGCAFQHIRYERQLEIKRSVFIDDLRRIGGCDIAVGKMWASRPFRYRSRARFKSLPDGRIGFLRRGTSHVLPLESCLLFPAEVERFLREWNQSPGPPFFHQLDLLWHPRNGGLHVHLSHPPDHKAKRFLERLPHVRFSWKGSRDDGRVNIMAGAYRYRVAPSLFFQVNRFMWQAMHQAVEQVLCPVDTALDVYAGVGFFVPVLQSAAEKVIAVDQDGPALDCASRTFPHIQLIRSSLERARLPKAELVLVDPPRSGLSRKALGHLLSTGFKRLIYVSCSSATFARDTQRLIRSGCRPIHHTLLDLFPQTPHMESINLFERE